MLDVSEGEVHLRLKFSKGDFGGTSVIGSMTTEVCLICQNRMQQFSQQVNCALALQVVSDESKLERLSDDDDAIVAPDKVISLVDSVVEDDLILAMPMIPRHKEGQCPGTEYEQEATVLPEVQGRTKHLIDLSLIRRKR
ncbi:MAG: YceD family protein [Candidatus Azotimanducaceae bacterium WSBS_2022_MAG_OTU7]